MPAVGQTGWAPRPWASSGCVNVERVVKCTLKKFRLKPACALVGGRAHPPPRTRAAGIGSARRFAIKREPRFGHARAIHVCDPPGKCSGRHSFRCRHVWTVQRAGLFGSATTSLPSKRAVQPRISRSVPTRCGATASCCRCPLTPAPSLSAKDVATLALSTPGADLGCPA